MSPPRVHVAKFYGRLLFIRSVLRSSKFYMLKMIEIVNLWVYHTIPLVFSLFRYFGSSLINFLFFFLNYLVMAKDH